MEKDLDVKSTNGHCSSDEKSESGCTKNSDGDKYSKDKNLDNTSNSSHLEDVSINKSEFNTTKKELKNQGTEDETVQLASGMKTLQIPILDGVKVKELFNL